MSDVITATHIANRALQRVGAGRIAAGALFTEDSKNASECAACYDILRRAELRRNVWRCSIRRAPLRPVDTTTMAYTPPAWAVGTTYAAAAIVTYNGTWYSSLTAANVGNTPGDDTTSWTRYFGPNTASLWDATVTYYAGEIVYIATTAYLSLINTNTSLTSVGASWLTLTGTVALVFISYPASVGPVSSDNKSIYMLPQGFMRKASQNPNPGLSSTLGYPSNPASSDWVFENTFFMTSDTGLVIFRFAADITNASEFDPLFVEGLGCKIALEVCEPLTQSTTKHEQIKADYKTVMRDARAVNGIETGSDAPPLDDYISTRY